MVRVLFVCEGNTCRSPMAAGIAEALFADKVQAESAGIDAGDGRPAAHDAVVVMHETYGVDLSRHRTRDTASVPVADFAYVVALSGYVGDRLRADKRIPPRRVVVWEIEDPLLKGTDVYGRVAGEIESRVRDLLRSVTVGGPPQDLGGASHEAVGMADRGIQAERDKLKLAIREWQREIGEGQRRPTGLVGISSKLVGNLETLMRGVLGCHLGSRGVDYGNTLQTEFGGKALDKLTFGQVVAGLRRLNGLTRCEIVRSATEKALWQLVELRNCLFHRQSEYASDECTLARNTDRLLALADAVTGDGRLFDFES